MGERIVLWPHDSQYQQHQHVTPESGVVTARGVVVGRPGDHHAPAVSVDLRIAADGLAATLERMLAAAMATVDQFRRAAWSARTLGAPTVTDAQGRDHNGLYAAFLRRTSAAADRSRACQHHPTRHGRPLGRRSSRRR